MSATLPNATLAAALDEARETYAARNPASRAAHANAASSLPGGNTRSTLFHAPFPLLMARGEVDFWEAVREPFLNREINRTEVQAVIERGLGASGGSYKRMLAMFGVRPDDYLKLMDFLRHHELKPSARGAGAAR